MKPIFSMVMIARNEAKTLPKLFASLKEFIDRGGETILVDTGSTDGTPALARSLGCTIVDEVGDRFMLTINDAIADNINKRFLVDNEPDLVQGGDRLFNFAAARNHSASLATNDMIATLDCDEAYTKLDIDAVENHIRNGIEQFEYQFVFAHDPAGKEIIKFIQSKFYNRTKVKWTNYVHEVLWGEDNSRLLVGEDVIKLEHWQLPGGEHRPKYLAGLALDCYGNQGNDRNSHYLAREMMWCGRPKSAIKEFERHIAMNRWLQEKAQSQIFMGDCYGMLGKEETQIECYHKAIQMDCSRRQPWMSLAHLYQAKGDHQRVACYIAGSLEIPWTGYYSDNRSHYEDLPHFMIYQAKYFMGDIDGSRYHFDKALAFDPINGQYLFHKPFYYPETK